MLLETAVVYNMAANGRSPKDLREIVASSQEDMSDMQHNLKKLKALSEDDKSTNALLKSRIDEQSQLIMILKQRADDATSKTRAVENLNEELVKFKESAQNRLQLEKKKYTMLDARFNDLAENHADLIKFKDEYKSQNNALRQENATLKEENSRLFSKAMSEKDHKILSLEKHNSTLQMHYSQMKQDNKDLLNQIKEKEEYFEGQIKTLQNQLKTTEHSLIDLTSKFEGATKSLDNVQSNSQKREQQLLKEKNEMLELSLQRGRIIQEKASENKKLQMKIDELERGLRDTELKFEQEVAAVNANEAIRRMKLDMTDTDGRYFDLKKEFDAFKKHSKELLEKERDLNAKLRHLVG